ncbi:NAD(P)H-binding protein [Gammaproteobacteria bacterium]|nr:NAD(P)H-binding protein [Gammaproteobacteria bacterium]
MKTHEAILVGASGLIGKHVSSLLINNKTNQIQLNRKSLEVVSEAVEEVIVDLKDENSFRGFLNADCIYITTGTRLTLMQLVHIKNKDRLSFLEVDFEMPLRIARAAYEKGVKKIALVSAIGANKKSNNFYLKTKGMLEEEILNIGFDKVVIARPGHLLGKRDLPIAKEVKIYELIFKIASPLMVSVLRKYRNIKAESVANSLISSVNETRNGYVILEYEDMMN